MSTRTIAQFLAVAGAVFAALLGICVLVAAGSVALNAATDSLASLELSNARDWRHAATAGAKGIVLVTYAVTHVTFCWRPNSVQTILVRAAFTLVGGVAAVRIVESALIAPSSPDCGMGWLANLAPFLFTAGFVVVETAAWAGWWTGSKFAASDAAGS